MTRLLARRLRAAGDDQGSVLILALVFVAVVGLVGGAIALFATSTLAQTSSLQADRSTQFAAESAIQVAIQTVRDIPGAHGDVRTAPGYNGTACPNTNVTIPENGINGSPVNKSFTVVCVVGQSPQEFERAITFAACPSGVTNCLAGQATYTPTPTSAAIVVATATYYDLNNSFTFPTGTTNGAGGWSLGNAVDVSRWDITSADH